jgi:hypothetical protein
MADPAQPWSDWLHEKAMELAAGRGATSLPVAIDVPDIFKSAGVGLTRSAINAAGAPGDIRSTAGRAADWIGIPESIQSAASAAAGMLPHTRPFATNPGSRGIEQMVSQLTGPFYEPQTLPGRVWEKNANRAGNLVLGGALVRGAQLGDRGQALVRALMK